MLDTPMPSSEEHAAGYKKRTGETVEKLKKVKSAREAKKVEADLEARIAGYQEGAKEEASKKREKQERAKKAPAVSKAKSEAGKAVWEKRKQMDEEVMRQQQEKIIRAAKADLREGREKEKYRELVKLVKMYQEGGEEALTNYLLKESTAKVKPTQEELKSDAKAQEYLKKMFPEDNMEQTLDNFIVSLPTEDEYVENILESINKPAPTEDGKISGEIEHRPEKIAAIKNEGAAEPGLSAVEIDRQYVKESQVEEAQAAYVRAYREYDPKFTENKTDDLLAVTRPPFFAFGAKAKELKNLYNALDLARKNAASESDEERIRKNLPVAPDKPSRRAAPLGTEGRAALEESWYEPEEKSVKVPIHERVASSKNILEDTGKMLMERGGGIHRRVKEIEAFFSKKYGLNSNEARKFLLSAEIKGLFKGGERRRQEEYKGYFKNELYQKFLKENPER